MMMPVKWKAEVMCECLQTSDDGDNDEIINEYLQAKNDDDDVDLEDCDDE